MSQCQAITKKGRQCNNRAGRGSKYCLIHQQNLVGRLCTLAAIVAGNLVPAMGVVYFGWGAENILILYWLETVIVGFFAYWRMRLALGNPGLLHESRRADVWNTRFFLIHYGGFMFILGIAMVTVCGSIIRWESNTDGCFESAEEFFREMEDHRQLLAALWRNSLLIGLFALFIEHAAWFYFGYFQNESFKRTTTTVEMFKPYPRLVALHLSLLLALLTMGNNTQIIQGRVAVLSLVTLHLLIDVITWAVTLQKEGALGRIRGATLGGLIGGGCTFAAAFVLAVVLAWPVALLWRLFGWAPIADERWIICAIAAVSCFAASATALFRLLDAIPSFREQSVREKRLVWAVLGAIAITALIVWGASKVLPMLAK